MIAKRQVFYCLRQKEGERTKDTLLVGLAFCPCSVHTRLMFHWPELGHLFALKLITGQGA